MFDGAKLFMNNFMCWGKPAIHNTKQIDTKDWHSVQTQLRRNFSQRILYRMQRKFPDYVFNYFQLTTFAVMILLVDVSHFEMVCQNAMTWAKLRQLSKDMTNQDTHEMFHWIGVIKSRAKSTFHTTVVKCSQFIQRKGVNWFK